MGAPEDDDWLFDYVKAKVDEYDALVKPLDAKLTAYDQLPASEITQENYEQNESVLHQRSSLWAAREAYYDVMKKRVFHV